MLSNFISEDMTNASVSGSDSTISVLISNYPLSNGGYLVSFGRNEPDGSFENFVPAHSVEFLECSSTFLPKGCFYLPDMALTDFIRSLAFDASFFDLKLLPASGNMQGLLLVKVNGDIFSKYEQEEEE